MELNCTNIIQVAQQCKEASSEFVVPNLNFVIISTGNDERFVEVKVYATDGSVVFFEAVDDSAYAVIPSVANIK